MEETTREQQLQEILVAYLESVESGRAPKREKWLEQHSEFATELEEFLTGREKMEQVAQPLKNADEPVSNQDAPTIAPSSANITDIGPKIRYFGDYELLEEIGRGGMGVVYKAKQVSLKRTVALKMILTGQLANDDDVKRFHAEAEAAAKLDHPGIVPVYEVGMHEGHHYFAMAYVDGESLARKVATDPLPPREAAVLTKKVAEAVSYAHIEGVIHRDVKPANILIDTKGQPRVTDFGLAKRLASSGRKSGEEALQANAMESLTATGQILGTPSYMPPEQASGKRGAVGPASDVYSLGAVLYCLVTGRPPFQAATALDTLLQVLDHEPVPPRHLNSSIPRDLETICLKCLQKEPGKRYASAQELVEELQRFSAGKPILARPIGVAGRAWRWCRRKPALATASALAAIALLVTLILAVVFAIYQTRTVEQNRLKLSESYLDKGQTLCEQGDVARGMLWFARSLETAPSNAVNLQRAIRANLGAWNVPGARLRMVFPGITTNVTSVAMSSDGKTVFTAHQNELRSWDAATGKPIGEPIVPKSYLNTESFSPDGAMFAVGGSDPNSDVVAVIWDTAKRKPLRTLRLPPEDFRKGGFNPNAQKTAFSPHSKILVTTNYRSVQLWDVATGKPIGPTFRSADGGPSLHKSRIEALALSPDGKTLATGGRDSTVRLWDATTGMPLGKPLPHEAWVRSVAFSPDGKTLLSGAFGGTARFWDVATGKLIGAPINHRGFIYAVAFSPNGRQALTAAGDVMREDGENSARLWDVATHKPIGMALHHRDWVEAAAFSLDGKTIVTAGGDDVCLWDVPASQPAEMILKHDGPVVSVAYRPDGKVVATASVLIKPIKFKDESKGEVRFWDSSTGKPLGDAVATPRGLRKVVFSPDGKVLAATIDTVKPRPGKLNVRGPAWEVRLIDVATHQPVGQPLELWGQVGTVSFGADSKTIITEDYSELYDDQVGMIRVWDVATGKVIDERKKPESQDPEVHWFDGKRVRMGGGGDNIVVFTEIATNKVLGLIQSLGGTGPTAISPNGTLMVTAGGRAQQLWDLATCKPIGSPLAPVVAVAFSPDSKRILTGSRDGNARLRPVPPVVGGTVDRVALWVEVVTGSALDRNYPARRILRPEQVQSRQQQLEKLGGPPLP